MSFLSYAARLIGICNITRSKVLFHTHKPRLLAETS